MQLNLESLTDAIAALNRSIQAKQDAEQLSLSATIKESIDAGIIQNFEVAYEIAWKMIKRWIQENIGTAEADGVTRRELFRIARENKLISDIETWMDFHDSRNQTSHTYNAITAKAVCQTAHRFLEEVKALLRTLEQRND